MFNINYLREHPDLARENLTKRQDPKKLKLVEEILSLDKEWRAWKGELDDLRHRRNDISLEINKAKKENKDVKVLVEEAKTLPRKIEELEKHTEEVLQKIRQLLLMLPNMLHPSVPFGKDDTENEQVKTFGKMPTFDFDPASHVDLLAKWNLADIERAAKISGARWYFLKNELAILEMAISKYAIDFMIKKGFAFFQPPYMISRKPMEGVVPLGDFEEALYKIEGEDLYNIATSEQPMTAMYMDEVLEEKQLPIKMTAFSPCFRKEAGAHGKDTKGIFRTHQFNKVEQVVIAKPEESWHIHEELLANAVEFFESLGLHGRIVNICTGDIGMVASKKYDIEVWMPVQKAYREVVSCSNCTDYQAIGLNIKYLKAGKEREYVHTLNSTCVATGRALVAIMENFQDKKGAIHIPQILQKYCGFKKIGK
ncbi:MAG: serine--tRNA ligase [Candidatus Aenigmarchaeota archaeon]|nr:serine--tRNA ligase [Candidatus Aenigmarchaeota archaeon]